MKIVFFEIEEWEKPLIKDKLGGEALLFDDKHLSKDSKEEYKDAEIISIKSTTPDLDEPILSQFPNLKLITTRTTGYDHIDLAYCKGRNITVCNVPDYGSYTVAEHTFALLLAIAHKIVPAVQRTRQGDFQLDGLRGFELHGKTLGVVGLGSIGKAVIKIAMCFGMNVVCFARTKDEALAKELGFTYVDLPTLLGQSDIVSLHVPYTKETHHMINKENIKLFKKGCVLINTARGGIVETEAILIGLEEGHLSGAGLDVLEEECMIKEETELLTEEFLKQCDLKTQLLNHVLLTKENVIITPHNAFNSTEALRRIIDTTNLNILAFLKQSPQNVVVLRS